MTLENKILMIVDDEQAIREAVDFLLVDSGYTVITAKDGKDALRKLECIKVDLVITDILMPEMDGIELIDHIKKNNPQIKSVVVSAGDPNYLVVTKHLGADRVIEKPFCKDDLIQAVEQLLV